MSVGIKTGILTGIKTGIRTGISGGIYAAWPESTAALKAITLGYGNWTNIYTLDEASGNLIDKTGLENLTTEITPVYRQTGPTSGKYSVLFNVNEFDSFYAGLASHKPGLGEFTCLAVVRATNVGGTRLFMSKAGTGTVQSYFNPSSQIVFTVSDSVNTATATIAGVTIDNSWHVVLLTISRGSVQRLRIAVDAITPVEADLTSVGAINPTNRMRVGSGDFGSGRVGDLNVAYIAFGSSDAEAMRLTDTTIISNFKNSVGMV